MKGQQSGGFYSKELTQKPSGFGGRVGERNINSRDAADACVSRLNITQGGLNLKVELVSASPGLCERVNNS